MTEVAQPAPGQDPKSSTGPWADSVNQAFGDDPVLAARVGQFMQTHYQPYVTRLENERNGSQDAQAFYNAFQEDAGEAFLSLAGEMFGEEAVDAIVQALQDEEIPTEEAEVPEQNQYAQLDPTQAELLAWAAEQKAAQAAAAEQSTYEELKTAYLKDHEAINAGLFDPFVAANDGDFELARQAYEQFTEGFTPATPPAAAPATVPGSAPAPAVTKQYTSFDDAWDDFEAEQRALRPAPPTV